MWNLNSNDQAQGDWRTLANDLERRIDLLTGSFEEIRHLVHRLAAQAALSESALADPAPARGAAVAVEEPPPPPVREPILPKSLPAVDAGWTGLDSWRSSRNSDLAPAVETPPASDALWRNDHAPSWPASVEPVVPEARAEPEAQVEEEPAPPEPTPVMDDGDEAREQVRKAVAQLRAELGDSEPVDEVPLSPVPEIVLQSAAVNDMDAVREEVRRAVEAARTEIDAVRAQSAASLRSEKQSTAFESRYAGSVATDVAPAAPEKPQTAPILPPPSANRTEDKSISASTIVIEDSEGRVELVRVYDALSRVECADNALLLNYTPHSVTVGLGLAPLPDTEVLKKAVSQVFQRTCEASLEGGRLSITLTDGFYRAA